MQSSTTNILSFLQSLNREILQDCLLVGLEKEGLRINDDGHISQRTHPITLGSKLTHPSITTDYSEALLELITKPGHTGEEVTTELLALHAFVYQQIESDELVWPASMPCLLTNEEDIPIADYGSSAIGQMKTIYRQGLAHRYGKNMQTIAGVHYNCSFSDALVETLLSYQGKENSRENRDALFMGVVRNILRYGWLLIYLFGASPAACRCFDKANQLGLKNTGKSLVGEYSTSLRMSDAGYQNEEQAKLNISYNSLAEYLSGLMQATSIRSEEFAKYGVKTDDGYQQLNDHILQIEAEYYSIVRPKRVSQSGERPIKALARRGIEYFELRMLDLNPFEPAGVSAAQLDFIDCFMLFCLFQPSPEFDSNDMNRIRENQNRVALLGRQPDLLLFSDENQEIPLTTLANSLFIQLNEIAAEMDKSCETNKHNSIEQIKKTAGHGGQLPSARILSELESSFDHCFFDLGMSYARAHQRYYKKFALSADYLKKQQALATESWLEQQEIEKNCASLEQAIADYFAD